MCDSRLQSLTLQVLIDRLVLRRQYCLAIRICQYLKIPESEGASRILAHWACYKVILIRFYCEIIPKDNCSSENVKKQSCNVFMPVDHIGLDTDLRYILSDMSDIYISAFL